ncbi:MAG: hypothetical protein KA144_12060 [Xanthomonadaceae bacterium]|nr:hypothetical protein [Xanthomonadaceae bacterium]
MFDFCNTRRRFGGRYDGNNALHDGNRAQNRRKPGMMALNIFDDQRPQFMSGRATVTLTSLS